MGCFAFKLVRELGLERRETVRSLSAWTLGFEGKLLLVREDRSGEPLVFGLSRQCIAPVSYVSDRITLKDLSGEAPSKMKSPWALEAPEERSDQDVERFGAVSALRGVGANQY